MATNLALDDQLIEEARVLGGASHEARGGHTSIVRLRSKKETASNFEQLWND